RASKSVAVHAAGGRRGCRCGAGFNASGLVLPGRGRDGATAGSAKSSAGNNQNLRQQYRGEFLLARNRRNAALPCLRMASQADHEREENAPQGISRSIRIRIEPRRRRSERTVRKNLNQWLSTLLLFSTRRHVLPLSASAATLRSVRLSSPVVSISAF